MSGGKFSKTFFCLPRWTRKQTESWPLRWLQSRAGFCRLRKVEAGAAGWQSNVRRLLGYERSVLPNHPLRHIRRKHRILRPRSRWRRRSSNGSDDARPARGSALRLSMITAPISSETSTSVTVPSKNAYLIFIMCPFRLRRHRAAGTQKEPVVTTDSPADNTYKKAWQSTVGTSSSKNPCGVFGSLCIPPPLMRISRL